MTIVSRARRLNTSKTTLGRSLLVAMSVIVAILFAAALVSLWRAGTSSVLRERRREETQRTVSRADAALAGHGVGGLAVVPRWPETLSPGEWAALDRLLAVEAAEALAPFTDSRPEGGYYLPFDDRYLGRAARKSAEPLASNPPADEFDLIDAQVREALRRDRSVERTIETSAGLLTLRASPVWVNGRKVAATWILARSDIAGSLDSTLRDYRRAAALALGGIVLALILTAILARTVRRQNVEAKRIQNELRRGERLAALGKLLAGVAHEIRNPLAGIRSTAQLWNRGIGPEPESIAGVVAEVDRLDAIVAQLLRFSHAEGLERHLGALNDAVAEAAKLAFPSADEREVRIELDLNANLPPVEFSSPAILQVLRNLTANALAAMPDGGVLRLTTRPGPSAETVQAIVADSGPGLSPEALAHLFEPFFTTKPDGTGLGLPIAREIALAHGGNLDTSHEVGLSGACFILSLPAAVVEDFGGRERANPSSRRPKIAALNAPSQHATRAEP